MVSQSHKGDAKTLPAHRAQAQSDPLVQEKSDETLCLEISQSKETNVKQVQPKQTHVKNCNKKKLNYIWKILIEMLKQRGLIFF